MPLKPSGSQKFYWTPTIRDLQINNTLVLYMSSSFWLLLGIEYCDFSQAEKERTACKAEWILKMTPIFTQNNNLGPFWLKIGVIVHQKYKLSKKLCNPSHPKMNWKCNWIFHLMAPKQRKNQMLSSKPGCNFAPYRLQKQGRWNLREWKQSPPTRFWQE